LGRVIGTARVGIPKPLRPGACFAADGEAKVNVDVEDEKYHYIPVLGSLGGY